MITLSKKIKEERDKKEKVKSTSGSPKISRISVRDTLLVKEVTELEENALDSCKVEFKDPNVLHEFTLTITPGKKVNLFPSFSVQTYCTVFINFYFLNWKEKATGRMGFLSFMSLYQRIIT